MSALRSPGARLSVSVQDGITIVAVVGQELFDLVDDFLAAEASWDVRLRLPSAEATFREPHLIYLPAGVSLDEAWTVLGRLSPEEVDLALVADGVA